MRTAKGARLRPKVSETILDARSSITPRALEELCGMYGDLTLTMDEVGRAGSSRSNRNAVLEDLAYVVTSGRGRMRSGKAQRDELKNQTWSVLALISTEERIEGETRIRDRKRGEQVRLIEVSVPAVKDAGVFDNLPGAPASFSKRSRQMAKMVETVISRHYGLAMRAFIDRIIEDREVASKVAKEAFERFLSKTVEHGDSTDRRLASKFALVFAAGVLASQFELAPWTAEALEEAITRIWRRASLAIGNEGSRLDDALNAFRRASRDDLVFPYLEHGSAFTCEQRARASGFRRKSKKLGHILAIARGQLPSVIGSGMSPTAFIEHLSKLGLVLPGSDGKSTRQLRVEGWGREPRPRFVVIDLDRLACSD